MASTLPINIPITSECAVASYNFVDITSGSGYIDFYAGKTVDKNLLSNFTFYGDTIYTEVTGSGALTGGYDFDILINRPMTIQGTGIVNHSFCLKAGTSGCSAYATITLRKWDGATETDIATNVSSTSSTASTSGLFTYYDTRATDLTIPTTTLKAGEYLRLTIDVTCATGANPGGFQLAHDPIGRSATWDASGASPSTLTLQLPVRIDL